MKRSLSAVALALIWVLCSSPGWAAEIKVLVTNAFKPVIAQIAPSFESSTGHKLSVRAEASGILQEEIVRGDNFDVAILISSNLDAVEKGGKTVAATRANIARAGLGFVVRAGQPKPNISTVEAFKQAIVQAKSVAYTTRGASGTHFMAVCERLGIADQVKAKAKTMPSGNVAELVAKGDAEVAIQQMSELIVVKGVDIVGVLPPEIDLISQIVAAVSAGTKESEAGKTFIRFLTSPDVAKVVKASGLEPG